MPLPPSSVSSGRNKRESPSQLRNFGTAKSRARWVRPEVGGRKPVFPFGLFFLRKTPRQLIGYRTTGSSPVTSLPTTQ